MKKLLFGFLAISLALTGTVSAQRNCGTMDNHERLVKENPSLTNVMEQIEEQTNRFIAANGSRSVAAVYNIPVVVHVIYNTTTQNISDAQIQSQITILNEDFRRTNADKVNTPSTFTSVAADCEINFCLATKDPNGSSTSGITRTSTSVTSFDASDKMKYNSTGGKDAWPAGSYLNIWVCNLGGGLLGYAQFPGGAAATDGVVVGYKYFGNTGTATAPFNKGRTATHEVGHWLNLRHIWGDASCGNDYVSDTPVHATSNTGCPTHPKSNSCGTTAEQFMNYMDYSDDACMNMFTLGQKSRMQAVLASGGARASLATSAGCSGTTTASYCSAKGSTTSYEWISNVKLNTINNTTTGSGGYADYTGISTDLAVGKAYTISLTPAFASTAYTEYFKVFIDYNNDKDFADSGELVYTSAGTTSAVSASFTVPSTATLAKTRMRIIMKDGSISGPCEQYTYGEVEDYSVNLISGSTSSTLTIGSGTGTTGIAPYGTYYMDERVQFIITKTELVNAGYSSSNNILKSLGFNIATLSSQTMNAFTIKIAHTTATAFGSSSFLAPAMTTVYSANFTPVSGWNTHTFSTAFTYNGTDNLLIDICWNNSSYTSDSKVYYTAQSTYKTLYKKADVSSGGVCGNTTGTLSYDRPNMKLVLGSSTSAKLGDTQAELDVVAESPVKFNMYPNPVSSDLTVNYNVDTENSNVKVTIYNLMGAVIETKELSAQSAGNHTLKMDLSSSSKYASLNNGIYLLSLNVNGKMETQRFVLVK